MVCTVRRYTGPLVLYSCISSRSVCSPPRTAGYTTSRTASAGRASEASAMANRMFSLPVTRRNALISSSVTFRSARAPIRCTVAISRSTRLSVTSRSRSASSAASRVTADCGEFGQPPPQVGGRLDRGPRPPPGHHLRRGIGEQAGRQADRADRGQLADLRQHRLQAHVPRHRLDQRQQAWTLYRWDGRPPRRP